MKKLFMFSMMLAIAASCSKEEKVNPQATKTTILFEGVSAPATKLQMLKNDEVYKLEWSETDAIKLYSESFDGVEAAYSQYPVDSEKSTAIFSGSTNATITGIEDLHVVYPSSLSYSEGKVTGTIPASQIQTGSSTTHLGQNTIAYGKTTIDGSNASTGVIKCSGSVSQKAAFVMVNLTAATEYIGYEVVGAELYAPEEKLAGTVIYNTEDETITVAEEGSSNVVGVEYETPQTIVENGEYKLYFVSAPRTPSGDLTVIVTLRKDGQTVTLPHKLPDGFKIESGKVSHIKLPIVKALNSYSSWYEPEESRYLAGGWSYGDANTIFSTYNNTKINFSVKARGDFANCVKPAKVALSYSHANDWRVNIRFITINGTNYAADTELAYDNSHVSTSKKVMLKDDCSFDITFGSSFTAANASAGKVLLLDESDNVIWAFNLWGCKTPINEVTLKSGIVIADKNIGGADYSTTPKSAQGGSFFFQWGRPFGFGWAAGICPFIQTSGVSLAYSASNAPMFFKSAMTGDWSDGQTDLWGNPNETSGVNPENGVKSIFDPCPKGWMVISPKAMEEVAAGSEYVLNATDGYWVKYKYDGSNYVYFPCAGIKYGNGTQSNTANMNVCAIWTNSLSSNSDTGSALYWWQKSGNSLTLKPTSNGRATGSPVRCMKDPRNL